MKVKVAAVRWLAVIILFYSIAHFLYSGVWFPLRMPGGDFFSAFPGPLIMSRSGLWAAIGNVWTPHGSGLWNYGPFLHFFTFPFILFRSLSQVRLAMLVLNYIFLGISFYIWWKVLFKDKPRLGLGIMCFIWMNYFPLLEGITGREIEILELFLISLSFLMLVSHRQAAGGTLLGIAGMTKFLPMIFIPYLFLKRHKKAFLWCLALTAFFVIFTEALLGWKNSLTLRYVIEGETILPAAYANQAIPNMLYKIFSPNINMNLIRTQPLYPGLVSKIGLSLSILLLAFTFWTLYKNRKSQHVALEFGILLPVMILTPQHANTYYLLFLVISYTIAASYYVNYRKSFTLLMTGALFLSYLISGFIIAMLLIELIVHVEGFKIARLLQLYSLPGFGALILYLILMNLYIKLNKGSA